MLTCLSTHLKQVISKINNGDEDVKNYVADQMLKAKQYMDGNI